MALRRSPWAIGIDQKSFPRMLTRQVLDLHDYRDVPLALLVNDDAVGDSIVGHNAVQRCGGGLPTAPATSARQQVMHLLHHDRRQIPHLRPAHARIHAPSQVGAAPEQSPGAATVSVRSGATLGAGSDLVRPG